MSYTATDTASLGATARELALSFPLQCLVPAVVLAVVGVTCRHLITRVRPSIFGDAGLSLHRAALASALAGLAAALSTMPAKEAARIRRAEQARAAAQDSTSLRLRRSVTAR